MGGTRTECSLVEMRSGAQRNASPPDCTLFEFRLRTDFGPRIRPEQCCVQPKTALCCSFESNRAPRSLLKIRIAIRSTELWRELEAVTLESQTAESFKYWYFASWRFSFISHMISSMMGAFSAQGCRVLPARYSPWGF